MAADPRSCHILIHSITACAARPVYRTIAVGAVPDRFMKHADNEMPPPWEQLATWVAVVEAGSVSGAAARLGVSQAGVSVHVRQLEASLGTVLLDRSTRPGRPTASGQLLVEHARQLLSLAGDMTHSVRSLAHAKRALVRIGCIDSFAATIGPQLVRALSARSHRVRLFSGLSPALNQQFVDRQMDVLITSGDPGDGLPIERLPLLTEEYCVVAPPGLDLSRPGSLTDLSRTLAFMNYSARSVIGVQITSYLRGTDPGLSRAFEFDATDPLLALVAAGLGFAITSPLCLWQARHYAAQVQVRPLRVFQRGGVPYAPLSRQLYLASHPGELGDLAGEMQEIVRVAAHVLKRELLAVLPLDSHAIEIHAPAV